MLVADSVAGDLNRNLSIYLEYVYEEVENRGEIALPKTQHPEPSLIFPLIHILEMIFPYKTAHAFNFLAVLCGLWHLSSLIRDWTQALNSEGMES